MGLAWFDGTWTWLGVFRSKRPQKNSEEIPGKHFFSFGKVHLQKKVGNLRIDENFYFLVHRTEWSKLRIQQQILWSQYILRWTFFVYFHFMKIFFPFKILGRRHSLYFRFSSQRNKKTPFLTSMGTAVGSTTHSQTHAACPKGVKHALALMNPKRF